MRHREIGWLAALALALSACQDETTAPAPLAAVPPAAEAPIAGPSLEVTLTQYRSDQARRVVQVKLGNAGAEPVRVEQAQLDAPGFEPVAASAKDTVLEPGDRVDLPVPYGAGRCQDAPAAPPSVVTRVRVADGPVQEVRLTLPAPDELLDRLLADECAQRALAEAVTIEFGSSWTAGPGNLRGAIVLRRFNSDEPITLQRIAGSVLFNIAAVPDHPAPLLALQPEAVTAELPVELTAPRCDSHAIGGSQRSYVFPLWLTLGDAPEQYTALEPDADGRRLLDELVQRSCGLSP